MIIPPTTRSARKKEMQVWRETIWLGFCPSRTRAATSPPAAATEEVLIHVRFFPNSDINMIGEKPAGLTANQWYERLLDVARPHYQTFAGGRGFFRIPRPCFEAILKDVAA
ncbi:hypothetical protein ACVILH_005015 [Bradyrhizobium sp. USDA 4353]